MFVYLQYPLEYHTHHLQNKVSVEISTLHLD